jgi:hypothetical protein
MNAIDWAQVCAMSGAGPAGVREHPNLRELMLAMKTKLKAATDSTTLTRTPFQEMRSVGCQWVVSDSGRQPGFEAPSVTSIRWSDAGWARQATTASRFTRGRSLVRSQVRPLEKALETVPFFVVRGRRPEAGLTSSVASTSSRARRSGGIGAAGFAPRSQSARRTHRGRLEAVRSPGRGGVVPGRADRLA